MPVGLPQCHGLKNAVASATRCSALDETVMRQLIAGGPPTDSGRRLCLARLYIFNHIVKAFFWI